MARIVSPRDQTGRLTPDRRLSFEFDTLRLSPLLRERDSDVVSLRTALNFITDSDSLRPLRVCGCVAFGPRNPLHISAAVVRVCVGNRCLTILAGFGADRCGAIQGADGDHAVT